MRSHILKYLGVHFPADRRRFLDAEQAAPVFSVFSIGYDPVFRCRRLMIHSTIDEAVQFFIDKQIYGEAILYLGEDEEWIPVEAHMTQGTITIHLHPPTYDFSALERLLNQSSGYSIDQLMFAQEVSAWVTALEQGSIFPEDF